MKLIHMNKNVENTLSQIKNTLDELILQGIVKFTFPNEYKNDSKNKIEQITWKNHIGGRDVSSKSFNLISQYFAILSSNAYQALLLDNSIIRCSFIFCGGKLITQNLLWWPCPVKVDTSMEEIYGLKESIKMLLEEKNTSNYLIMRSPIRIDFDVNNNTPVHPRAHIHMQHHETRINSKQPICFNRFMRHILENYYPYLKVDYDCLLYLQYNYDDKYKNIEYINKTMMII